MGEQSAKDKDDRHQDRDYLSELASYLDIANSANDINEIMAGFGTRDILVDALTGWLADLTEWAYFGTLTVADDNPFGVEREARAWKWLHRRLNIEAFGKRYQRIVGHSFFSYAVCVEYQSRGATHYHFLTSAPFHMAAVHDIWGPAYGFAWVAPVESRRGAARYLAKYVGKGGRLLEVYVAPAHGRVPRPMPAWWRISMMKSGQGEALGDGGQVSLPGLEGI